MCGIAGVWTPSAFSDTTELETRLGAMAATLVHRGPDDSGVWTNGKVGCSHRRLSIIDLTKSGHQPMHDSSGNYHIVFNGEIYNFQSLRHELSGLGHQFKSRSDTEVILNGYKQWGEDVLLRLRGDVCLCHMG